MLKECHLCKNRSSCMMPELNEYAILKCRLFNPIDPQTRVDRIRSMSDEELAAWLGDLLYPECACCPVDCDGWCDDCHGTMLSWLKMAGGLSKRPEENA